MDRPLISPNWLTSTTDLDVAVQSFKRARKIAENSGIAVAEVSPGSKVQSDEEIEKYIREATVPIHHASATCKAAPVTYPPVTWMEIVGNASDQSLCEPSF